MSSSYGQSSNVGRRLNNSLDSTPIICCNCSRKARLLYSWAAKNPRRRFYCYRNDMGNGCSFFMWHDLEINHPGYTEVVFSLQQEVITLRVKRDKLCCSPSSSIQFCFLLLTLLF
ncbi:hypothetical protein LINGRAHAP2_LOCUS9730 [Linum grandiflorum]